MENTLSPAVLCLDCQHGYHDIPFHLPQVCCLCPCHGENVEEKMHEALDNAMPLSYNKDVEA
jgi:hypothetical protein